MCSESHALRVILGGGGGRNDTGWCKNEKDFLFLEKDNNHKIPLINP